jgi:hypothetical protein
MQRLMQHVSRSFWGEWMPGTSKVQAVVLVQRAMEVHRMAVVLSSFDPERCATIL